MSLCSSISTPAADVHGNNFSNKDYFLCSNLCTCNRVLLGNYQNCRGLRTKLSILKCNVAIFDYIFICFTKTWLCNSFYDNELGLINYSVYRCDRSSLTSSFSRGGGALIAIRNDVVSNLICNPAINVKHVFVKFSYNHTNYVVCSVYFPPNSLISAYEAFMSTVQSVLLLHPDCVFIFCGDFNLPDVKWSNDDFGLLYNSISNPRIQCIPEAFAFFLTSSTSMTFLTLLVVFWT